MHPRGALTLEKIDQVISSRWQEATWLHGVRSKVRDRTTACQSRRVESVAARAHKVIEIESAASPVRQSWGLDMVAALPHSQDSSGSSSHEPTNVQSGSSCQTGIAENWRRRSSPSRMRHLSFTEPGAFENSGGLGLDGASEAEFGRSTSIMRVPRSSTCLQLIRRPTAKT